MTVCKLAAYLENDSDHELPKQLKRLWSSELTPCLIGVHAEMLCLFRTCVKGLLQAKKDGIWYEMGYLHQNRMLLWR